LQFFLLSTLEVLQKTFSKQMHSGCNMANSLFYLFLLPGFVHLVKSTTVLAYDGDPIKPHAYPWMVTLYKTSPKGAKTQYCAGALIAPNKDAIQSDIILTAAHCVTSDQCDKDPLNCTSTYDNPQEILVGLGNHLLSKNEDGEIEISPSRLEHYAKYDTNAGFTHDIAVVKLSKPIRFTKTIQGIILPKLGEEIVDTQKCVMAGWGFTSVETQMSKQSSDDLKSLNVRILTNKDCIDTYSDNSGQPMFEGFNIDYLLCGVGHKHNATSCQGDSGGPLWCQSSDGRPIIHGVVSGVGTGSCGFPLMPTVYIKVAKYVTWIQDAMKRLSN
jgi:secreted trypsin-like serine protease